MKKIEKIVLYNPNTRFDFERQTVIWARTQQIESKLNELVEAVNKLSQKK